MPTWRWPSSIWTGFKQLNGTEGHVAGDEALKSVGAALRLAARKAERLSDLAAVRRDGYVILPDLLSGEEIHEIRKAVVPLLNRSGRSHFEGHTYERVYSVLNETRSYDRIADHPRVLALLGRLLVPNYLLSMLQVIKIMPGERAQMLHTDDGSYPTSAATRCARRGNDLGEPANPAPRN